MSIASPARRLRALARRAFPWLLLVAGLVWFSRNVRPTGAFPVGSRLPALTGQLADGTSFTLNGPPREVVVLNFWATYCGPCRDEAPLLQAVHARGVRVVGFSLDELPQADVQNAARKLGMHYPVGLGNPALLQTLNVRSIPTTYVLAPDGSVVLSRVGALSRGELEAAVRTAGQQG